MQRNATPAPETAESRRAAPTMTNHTAKQIPANTYPDANQSAYMTYNSPPYAGISAPLTGANHGEASDAITPATWPGWTHL